MATDYNGGDLIIGSSTSLSGLIYNVGLCQINSGVTVTVNAYAGGPDIEDGQGRLVIKARVINLEGTINADGAGYRGGSGGAGSRGANGKHSNVPSSSPGSVGEGSYGGTGASSRTGVNWGTVDPEYQFHRYWHGENGFGGSRGGYRSAGANGDATTDTEIYLGSGGGGGSGGTGGGGFGVNLDVGGGGGAGGGAGNPGGGMVSLYATEALLINGNIVCRGLTTARGNGGAGGNANNGNRLTGGAGGVGGNRDAAGSSAGATGGVGTQADGVTADATIGGGNGGAGSYGAGGGCLLYCSGPQGVRVTGGTVDCRGGATQTVNGGTYKIIAPSIVDSGTHFQGRFFTKTVSASSGYSSVSIS